MNVAFDASAAVEMAEALYWYESQSSGLGAEFLRSDDACLDRLHRLPNSGAPVEAQMRRISLRRFPFQIFYVVDSDKIVILAILHASRDPEWRRRRLD